MNDDDLSQLLRDADAQSSRSTIRGDLAMCVRTAAVKQAAIARRRKLAAAVLLPAVAIFVGLWHSIRSAPIKQPAALVMTPSAVVSRSDLDRQIVTCEAGIRQLELVERLNNLKVQRARIVDPIADLDERAASAMLARVSQMGEEATTSQPRREILAIIAQLYPNTLSAAVALREAKDID